MAATFKCGDRVVVAGRGAGMLELDNGNGTWNVYFDDQTEDDFAIGLLEHEPDGVLLIEQAGGPQIVPAPYDREKPPGWSRFVCFSDTHGLHDRIPAAHRVTADVLLHGGDFTNTGEVEQVRSFANWLNAYPATHKVVIAGNHDVTFEPSYYEQSWKRYHSKPYNCSESRQALVGSGCCTYLEDQLADIMGYTIYGSPWSPTFCDWAFNAPVGEGCKEKWDMIPPEVDILMTHGPPFGYGDTTCNRTSVGCKELLKAIEQRAVSVNLCGHIHEGYGVDNCGNTLCVNASTCTHSYVPSNPPIVFDLPPPEILRRVVRTEMTQAMSDVA